MVEGLLDCYPLCRVKREQLLDQVEEGLVDRVGGRDDFLSRVRRLRCMLDRDRHRGHT